MAHDIGWGRWQQKATVVPKWIARANAAAEDLVSREQGSSELIFRVHERTLAALAGIVEPPDASARFAARSKLGQKTFDDATDPVYQAQVAWRWGSRLGRRGRNRQTRVTRPTCARPPAELVLNYFEQGDEAGQRLPNHDFLLGRLFYRMGASRHRQGRSQQGVAWFDQAVPLLGEPGAGGQRQQRQARRDVRQHGRLVLAGEQPRARGLAR